MLSAFFCAAYSDAHRCRTVYIRSDPARPVSCHFPAVAWRSPPLPWRGRSHVADGRECEITRSSVPGPSCPGCEAVMEGGGGAGRVSTAGDKGRAKRFGARGIGLCPLPMARHVGSRCAKLGLRSAAHPTAADSPQRRPRGANAAPMLFVCSQLRCCGCPCSGQRRGNGGGSVALGSALPAIWACTAHGALPR
ncbi:hypothetical protein DFH06DRAFT_1209846 [Mycena polygramma]|nr:hypothetical protein DFH06DRAFT_1209846 [Mycena polygramma]